MKIHLNTGDGRQFMVRAYEPGYLVAGENRYERSLILTPDRIIDDWRPQSLDEVDEAAIQELVDLQPEVVLLGTGREQGFPPTRCLSVLAERGIGIECMDTGAACRTYNLLMGEGRKVVAGLLLADPRSIPSVPAHTVLR